jgi:hypothetical protein
MPKHRRSTPTRLPRGETLTVPEVMRLYKLGRGYIYGNVAPKGWIPRIKGIRRILIPRGALADAIAIRTVSGKVTSS